MNTISQLAEWFPDVVEPFLVQCKAAKARYQEWAFENLEECINFQDGLYRFIRKKFQCKIPKTLREKLELIDFAVGLGGLENLYGRLMDAETLEQFEQYVDEEIRNSVE